MHLATVELHIIESHPPPCRLSNVIDIGRVVLSARSGSPSSAAFARTATAKYLSKDVGKSVLEVSVGHHVDDGVEGGVEVADPE